MILTHVKLGRAVTFMIFFSIMMMVTRNKTTKNICNSNPTTIYCAVGEKSKFKMLHSKIVDTENFNN